MLAGVKALSRYDLVAADRILLSADTIVTSVDGENIGKPSSRRHAHQILDVLIGHPHHVVTGVAVLAADEMRLSHESAEIFITRPSRDSFEQYLDSEAWRGAAGAYRLDDLRGRGWTVSTSLEPVGGLPIALLSEILGSFGVAAKHGGT
jgi:septum formation protein